MPRIPPSSIRKARQLGPHVSRLLPVCRDIRSAQNELRWLAEHSRLQAAKGRHVNHDTLLNQYIMRRARGEPLQYIMGTECFGDLEIRCSPGVLIPRQETAASVTYLVKRLRDIPGMVEAQERLRVLDLCTGTGCIPLLFHHEYYSWPQNQASQLDLLAVDISQKALSLTEENRRRRLAHLTVPLASPAACSLSGMTILRGDVLGEDNSTLESSASILDALQSIQETTARPNTDVLISNPPYISSRGYRTTTARSVRHFEPKLALLPDRCHGSDDNLDGDAFYHPLLTWAKRLKARVVLLEVADLEQAQRVASLATKQHIWDGIEIWRDEPSAPCGLTESEVQIDGTSVPVLGAGHGRSVFAYRGNTEDDDPT